MAARRGKNQARRNTSQGTPGWAWLVAGAAIAAVVFLAAPDLFKGKDGDGFLRVGPQANPNAQPAPVADADIDAAPELPRPAAGNRGQDAGQQKPATQYDFYTLLPGKEVQMSDAELAASARAEEQRKARAEAQRAQAALEGRPVPAAAAPTTTTPAAATTTAVNSTAALPRPVDDSRPAAATPASTATAATTPVATAAATPANAAAPSAAASTPATVATAAPAADSNVRYILQAGAFNASGDAEATKAKLAMMGLAARVESAQISGRTVYRVRMGPYGTASELSEAKQKLDGSGLQAMAIKAQ